MEEITAHAITAESSNVENWPPSLRKEHSHSREQSREIKHSERKRTSSLQLTMHGGILKDSEISKLNDNARLMKLKSKKKKKN